MTNAADTPTVLTWRPYQKACIDDRKHVQADFWCRQSGKDFTAAFKAVVRGLEDPHDRLIVSVTQRQADLTFDKVATHARAVSGILCPEEHTEFLAQVGGRPITFTRRQVTLPSGARIISLPGRDPDSLAGYTAHVILTEYALFPDGGHKHWRYVAPVALTNGLDVWVITTPRTKDTKAYDLRRNERGRYSVRVVDVHRAVADGLVLRDEDGTPCSVETFQEIYADPVGWQTEYLVQECDDLDALLSWADIEAAQEDYDCPVLDLRDDTGYDPRARNVFAELDVDPRDLTAGWDVARRRHLSALWINGRAPGTDRQTLRCLVLMRRCSFPFQRAIVAQALDTHRTLRGAGDATGLGMESNEALHAAYGERWRAVQFTAPQKIALASRLQSTFQARQQVIPRSAEAVAYDLHALQKEVRGDRTLIHETQNALESDSHCDIAYALALALEAASVDVAEPYLSVG